mgnify:FL=1
MQKNNNTIFLVTGGTGGHFFPALAVAQKDKKNKYIFVIDKRVEGNLKKYNYNYFVVSSSKIEKKIYMVPIFFFKIIKGLFKSIYLILKFKPSLIVGFGGYTSIPTVIAGKLLNVKILIHEQNALMGRTNRILSNFSYKTAISFSQTKFAKRESILTGIPIRYFKKKKIVNIKKRILICGGSQGAKIFSKIVPNILSHLPPKVKSRIIIIQQTRIEDKDNLSLKYKKMKIDFVLKNFFDDIQNQIYNSDIIFARCGSSTLAEIEYCKKSAFLFPLPNSLDNHQFLNAMEHKKINNCEIFDERNINYSEISKKLLIEIKKLKKNKHKTSFKKKVSLNKVINDIIKESHV